VTHVRQRKDVDKCSRCNAHSDTTVDLAITPIKSASSVLHRHHGRNHALLRLDEEEVLSIHEQKDGAANAIELWRGGSTHDEKGVSSDVTYQDKDTPRHGARALDNVEGKRI
jgi:phage protein D